MNIKSHFSGFLIIITIAFSSCQKSVDAPAIINDTIVSAPSTINIQDDDHMLLGNPDNATIDIVNTGRYLLIKSYYALSYHNSRGIPNWVSWHLHDKDLGTTPRQDDFRVDSTVPSNWFRVGSSNYTNSGFDRGHNCPSADRTESVSANSATFLMTNIMPQAPNNNQQTWGNLEDYERELIQQGNEVFIICGSYGIGGTGTKGFANTIDNGRITVPKNIWKVMVVLPNGNNDLKRISNTTRVIAVSTPNTNTLDYNWKTYRISVDELEALTGYNFLTNLPVSVQDIVESRIDSL